MPNMIGRYLWKREVTGASLHATIETVRWQKELGLSHE